MISNVNQQTIKVMADYECHPLWLTGNDLGDVAPDDSRLNLSPRLVQQLTEWAEEFDQTLDYDDPIASGFATHEAKVKFAETGASIASDLAQELGSSWRVLYHDIRSGTTQEIARD